MRWRSGITNANGHEKHCHSWRTIRNRPIHLITSKTVVVVFCSSSLFVLKRLDLMKLQIWTRKTPIIQAGRIPSVEMTKRAIPAIFRPKLLLQPRFKKRNSVTRISTERGLTFCVCGMQRPRAECGLKGLVKQGDFVCGMQQTGAECGLKELVTGRLRVRYAEARSGMWTQGVS